MASLMSWPKLDAILDRFVMKIVALIFSGRPSFKSSNGHKVWGRKTLPVKYFHSTCSNTMFDHNRFAMFQNCLIRWPGFQWPKCKDCGGQKAFVCQVRRKEKIISSKLFVYFFSFKIEGQLLPEAALELTKLEEDALVQVQKVFGRASSQEKKINLRCSSV